ncbi:MAG TPA: winged helix family transcriptional regulator, partial [bacterium (Candidatus Stahlbacteria)]|nr:winged helix family transcriptional regulator [Candidatus Stahlbacteria bacterium]
KDKKIELTPTEFRLLEILARNKKRVFTRNQLLDRLWEGEKTVVDRTIDVHIARLRKKLGDLGNMIKSVPGIGYKMEA